MKGKIKLPNLRRSRRVKKLSRKALARKARITTYVVAIVEQRNVPVLKAIAQRIAAAIGVRLTSLAG